MIDLTPERWALVSPIVDEAIELAPDRVEGFLDQACGSDLALRRDVERMLDACRRGESLLRDQPRLSVKSLIDGASQSRQQLPEGEILGHYRVVELIGRGGMGAVYLAERSDGEFEKQVALKVVKRGMDSDEILDRFRKERQILAGLDHPNIATLLDGGMTGDGRPYFVMELADGQPIDRFCDERGLTIRERLELFQDICDAVQYAHRNLVVHRDLKPSNILVTWQGEAPLVRLLDFGIAKVLDPTESPDDLTQALSTRLTPEYAAPEQVVNGPTTTATDVYSLGVILYRLLCGAPPYRFASGSMVEIEEQVCHKTPRLPSAQVLDASTLGGGQDAHMGRGISFARSTQPGPLRQTLSGDLDAITMKALEKEPNRRYGSAAELSADVGRYLEGLPVKAQRPTGVYRLRKFVGRNKLAVGLTAAVVSALVVGIGATSWQARVARQQSILRQAEAARAQETRDFVVDVFGAFNPDLRQGAPITAEAIVDKGLEGVADLTGRPELQLAVLNALGQVAFSLGQTERSEQIFSRALELFPPDSFLAHWDVTTTMTGLGNVALFRQQAREAVTWYRQALELREARPASDSVGIAANLIDLSFALQIEPLPENLREADGLLALAAQYDLPPQLQGRRWEVLGDVRFSMRSFDEAETAYLRAISTYRQHLGDRHPDLGKALIGLGLTRIRKGEPADAESPYLEAIEVFERAYGERHLFVGMSRYGLAEIYATLGRPEIAARYYGAAVDALNPQELAEAGLHRVSVQRAARSYLEADSLVRAEALLQDHRAALASTGRSLNPDERILMAKLDMARNRFDTAAQDLSTLVSSAIGTDPAPAWVAEADSLLAEIRKRAVGPS